MFKPGVSGNPKGRPKNIIDKRTKLRELLEPHAEEIIEKLASLAKNGDLIALKLCIERLVPRVKQDESINFDLPEGRIDTGDNMLQIVNNITLAVASGQLTIKEAEKFTLFLNYQRQNIKIADQRKKAELHDEERAKYWEAISDEEISENT